MALVPTLVSLGIGLGLGLRWGGRLENLPDWRPVLPVAFAVGITAHALNEIASFGGALGTLLAISSLGSLLAFATFNVRTGGMVLVVAGLGADLLVTLVNWGRPVSGSALVSAGLVELGELDAVTLTGGRELADGAVLGFLGDVLPLPWGQVISLGSLLTLVGIALVTSSVLRRYEVAGGGPRRGGGPAGVRRRVGGPSDYRTALDALGRGPAPRRGPGLHPSRLEERRRTAGRGATLRPSRQSGSKSSRSGTVRSLRGGGDDAAPRRRPGTGPR